MPTVTWEFTLPNGDELEVELQCEIEQPDYSVGFGPVMTDCVCMTSIPKDAPKGWIDDQIGRDWLAIQDKAIEADQ